ncbi:MAG TPA: DUF2461 domain-containing protein [Xanthomonadaceae bacterium]|nr:DUF2461 domain-containing protein [Xanthomonadaceae bacterium]
MATYFTPATFRFLRSLARHNERAWFREHRDAYEAHVRAPFLRLIGDLQPALAEVSAHYRADPRRAGGSLFRIHRDTRFSGNKAPYKTWQGARLFHARRREAPAPSFYIHVEPGGSFVGAGLWHPGTPTQRRVRQFIHDNPAGWKTATRAPAFRRKFALGDREMLVRVPAGFPPDSPLADDLRRRNFVASRPLGDDLLTGPRLLPALARDLAMLAPLVDYLCASLDLEF